MSDSRARPHPSAGLPSPAAPSSAAGVSTEFPTSSQPLRPDQAPMCPRCEVKLIPKQNRSSGEWFWACPNRGLCSVTMSGKVLVGPSSSSARTEGPILPTEPSPTETEEGDMEMGAWPDNQHQWDISSEVADTLDLEELMEVVAETARL